MAARELEMEPVEREEEEVYEPLTREEQVKSKKEVETSMSDVDVFDEGVVRSYEIDWSDLEVAVDADIAMRGKKAGAFGRMSLPHMLQAALAKCGPNYLVWVERLLKDKELGYMKKVKVLSEDVWKTYEELMFKDFYTVMLKWTGLYEYVVLAKSRVDRDAWGCEASWWKDGVCVLDCCEVCHCYNTCKVFELCVAGGVTWSPFMVGDVWFFRLRGKALCKSCYDTVRVRSEIVACAIRRETGGCKVLWPVGLVWDERNMEIDQCVVHLLIRMTDSWHVMQRIVKGIEGQKLNTEVEVIPKLKYESCKRRSVFELNHAVTEEGKREEVVLAQVNSVSPVFLQ